MSVPFRVGGLYRWKGLTPPYSPENFFHLYPCGHGSNNSRNSTNSSYRAAPGTCFIFLEVIPDGPNFFATCLAPDGTVHEASIPHSGMNCWEEVTEQEEMENE